MSDRLREALDVWVTEYVEVLSRRDDLLMEPLEEIVAAARRFLALTETGQRVEWCEVHQRPALSTRTRCRLDHSPAPCRIVPKLLADYLTEEE